MTRTELFIKNMNNFLCVLWHKMSNIVMISLNKRTRAPSEKHDAVLIQIIVHK